MNDNFDFVSDNNMANKLNEHLKNIFDPNDIGKRVEIIFEDALPCFPHEHTLIKAEFNEYEKLQIHQKQDINFYKQLLPQYASYFKKLINSDVANYTQNGKFVIYKEKNDEITLTRSGFDLKSEIPSLGDKILGICGVYIKTKLMPSEFIELSKTANEIFNNEFGANLNPHKDKLKNGFYYVGSDKIEKLDLNQSKNNSNFDNFLKMQNTINYNEENEFKFKM